MSELLNEHVKQGLTALGFIIAALWGGFRLWLSQKPDSPKAPAATNDMIHGSINNVSAKIDGMMRRIEQMHTEASEEREEARSRLERMETLGQIIKDRQSR